jgi:hypothetical protein
VDFVVLSIKNSFEKTLSLSQDSKHEERCFAYNNGMEWLAKLLIFWHTLKSAYKASFIIYIFPPVNRIVVKNLWE